MPPAFGSPGLPRIWRKDEKVAHNCLLLLHLQLPSLPSQLWLPQLFSISFRHLGMEVKSSEMCFGVQNTPHAATLPFRNNYHQHCRHSLQCFVGGPNPKPVYCIFGIIFTNIKPASWVVLCPSGHDIDVVGNWPSSLKASLDFWLTKFFERFFKFWNSTRLVSNQPTFEKKYCES